MLKEFRDFAMRGNVVDMAVGIVIGAAFGKIISSVVADVLMPPVGLLLGGVDFSNLYVVLKQGGKAGPYLALAEAQAAGAVTLNYGLFLNQVVSFTIVAFALFVVVKAMNKMKRETPAPAAAPTTKDCPQCATAIPIAARRCPNCTSQLWEIGELLRGVAHAQTAILRARGRSRARGSSARRRPCRPSRGKSASTSPGYRRRPCEARRAPT